MPVMGGLEASKLILELAKQHDLDVNIVILTAFTNSNLAKEGKEVGIKKCIGKPLQIKQLHEVMHRYLFGVGLEQYKIMYQEKFQ